MLQYTVLTVFCMHIYTHTYKQNKRFLHDKHVGEANYTKTVFALAAQVTQYNQAVAAQQAKHTQELQAYTAQCNAGLATEALVIGTAELGTAEYGEN
jgi:hypothetical protein